MPPSFTKGIAYEWVLLRTRGFKVYIAYECKPNVTLSGIADCTSRACA